MPKLPVSPGRHPSTIPRATPANINIRYWGSERIWAKPAKKYDIGYLL